MLVYSAVLCMYPEGYVGLVEAKSSSLLLFTEIHGENKTGRFTFKRSSSVNKTTQLTSKKNKNS